MKELLTSLFGAVGAGLQVWNTKLATEFNRKSTEILLQIEAEEAKVDAADDSKIERLYREAKVLVEAAKNETLIHVSGATRTTG